MARMTKKQQKRVKELNQQLLEKLAECMSLKMKVRTLESRNLTLVQVQEVHRKDLDAVWEQVGTLRTQLFTANEHGNKLLVQYGEEIEKREKAEALLSKEEALKRELLVEIRTLQLRIAASDGECSQWQSKAEYLMAQWLRHGKLTEHDAMRLL